MGREKHWVIGTEERSCFPDLEGPIIEIETTTTKNKDKLHWW